MSDNNYLQPNWPAPPNVHACVTTRNGGVSTGPFASFNLNSVVGDNPAAVATNRQILRNTLQLPAEPTWLKQVHGTRVIDAAKESPMAEADASIAHGAGSVCAVLTADCLPVLFCDKAGSRVAAAHAGWRGLADGVLEATVDAMDTAPGNILAWFGPSIGPKNFVVDDDVRNIFIQHDPAAREAFEDHNGQWLGNMYTLARQRLKACGITQISGGGLCTYEDSKRFYSLRRDETTGRMASLVWLA
ncbi:MAG TPA: peptidoglycan editing factor PgeF [Gammaproteobacteria bacterium]|nr:peptidoglycan editing factor PgeF [Gammaproteobacteria bacterium]